MKRNVMTCLAVLFAIPNLSFVSDPLLEILSDEDLEYSVQELARGPALSAPLDGKTPYWESRDQWQCFATTDIVDMSCLEVEYGNPRHVPTIHVAQQSEILELTMDPDPEPDCDSIVNHWKGLLDEQKYFCTFAALLKDHEDDNAVWIINRLRTRKGFWDFHSESNWVHESPDASEQLED